jgi:hypothetical protein
MGHTTLKKVKNTRECTFRKAYERSQIHEARRKAPNIFRAAAGSSLRTSKYAN